MGPAGPWPRGLHQCNVTFQLKQNTEKLKKPGKKTEVVFLAEISTMELLYRIILRNNVQSIFCNAEITFRMYLSMMVTNWSGERSFSKLKIIKNRLRTSMKQDRLTNLIQTKNRAKLLYFRTSKHLEVSTIIKKNTKIAMEFYFPEIGFFLEILKGPTKYWPGA